MLFDVCRSQISLSDPKALESWNSMVLAFLAHGATTPTHLAAVLETEPEFAMGHAARGMFSMLMGRAELIDVARSAVSAAQSAARANSVSAREAHWIAALDHWLAGRPSGAIAANTASSPNALYLLKSLLSSIERNTMATGYLCNTMPSSSGSTTWEWL